MIRKETELNEWNINNNKGMWMNVLRMQCILGNSSDIHPFLIWTKRAFSPII
jgi:hypothetical protein